MKHSSPPTSFSTWSSEMIATMYFIKAQNDLGFKQKHNVMSKKNHGNSDMEFVNTVLSNSNLNFLQFCKQRYMSFLFIYFYTS